MPIDHGLEAARSSHPDHAHLQRSPHWEQVRKAHLAREPMCVACGDLWKPGTMVQVHHIIPFHFVVALGRPDLELDPRNLVTLCESEGDRPGQNHHLLLGHLNHFEALNPASRLDAAIFRGRSAEQLRGDCTWRARVQARLPLLAHRTDTERAALRAELDRLLPPSPLLTRNGGAP